MYSKLEAVNRCLAAIGEARVNSLNEGVPDAAEAAAVIDEVTTDVLSAGWHFNVIPKRTIKPDTNKKLSVVPNVITADTVGRSSNINVAIRSDPASGGFFLFNVEDETFEFDNPIDVTLTLKLSFEDLPYVAATYIAARSAKVFQERVLGSMSLDNFTARAEAEAWARFLDAEAEAGDYNALTQSPSLALLHRNQPIPWR